jgi:hypothetical protein
VFNVPATPEKPSWRTRGVNYHVLGNARGWGMRGYAESVIMSPWRGLPRFRDSENVKMKKRLAAATVEAAYKWRPSLKGQRFFDEAFGNEWEIVR